MCPDSYRDADVRMCRCADMPMCPDRYRDADVRMCRCADVPVCPDRYGMRMCGSYVIASRASRVEKQSPLSDGDLSHSRCADVRMCRCADMPMCRYADVPMCRCADMPMCPDRYRDANVPMCRCVPIGIGMPCMICEAHP
jgi:hypothetical protein